LVNINFTLILETGLFLVFLWLMYAYVLRPLLKIMDARAAQVAEDEATADNLESEYQEAERSYRLSLAGIHQRAAQRVAEAKREAQARNNEEIHALKAAGTERMSALLKQVREDMRQQRAASDQVVAEIKGSLAEKLGFGKGQS